MTTTAFDETDPLQFASSRRRLRALPPVARWMILTSVFRETSLPAVWRSSLGSGWWWRAGKCVLFGGFRVPPFRLAVRRYWWTHLGLKGTEIAYGTHSSVMVEPAAPGRVLKLQWVSAGESPAQQFARVTYLESLSDVVAAEMSPFLAPIGFERVRVGEKHPIDLVGGRQRRVGGGAWNPGASCGALNAAIATAVDAQWRALCAAAHCLYQKTGHVIDLQGRGNLLLEPSPQGPRLVLVDTLPIEPDADPAGPLRLMREALV